jgi:hypothetical protein
MDKLPKYLAVLGRAALSRFCCACYLDVFLDGGLVNTRPVSSYIECAPELGDVCTISSCLQSSLTACECVSVCGAVHRVPGAGGSMSVCSSQPSARMHSTLRP